MALKPLHDLGKVKRVVVSTYQSSSGKGAKGLRRLRGAAQGVGRGRAGAGPDGPPRRSSPGNVITLDWTLDPNGFTRGREQGHQRDEEDHRRRDDRRLPDVRARAGEGGPLARRSPSSSTGPFSVADAKAALAKAPGVVLMDETKGEFPQPIHAEGSDHTFVGRVRQDPSNPNALCLWVVADNLRKGAATNAVQCAEELVRRGIVK